MVSDEITETLAWFNGSTGEGTPTTLRRALRRHEKRAQAMGLHGVSHQIRIARLSHEPYVLAVRERTLRVRGARPLATGTEARRARFVYVLAADAVARYRAAIGGAARGAS